MRRAGAVTPSPTRRAAASAPAPAYPEAGTKLAAFRSDTWRGSEALMDSSEREQVERRLALARRNALEAQLTLARQEAITVQIASSSHDAEVASRMLASLQAV